MWDARWTVDQVTSRLTFMGAAGTDVYALETYPVDNAVITPQSPPCQTLCVRRTHDEPFLVVGDAWIDQPNLQTVTRGEGGVVVAHPDRSQHVLSSAGTRQHTIRQTACR